MTNWGRSWVLVAVPVALAACGGAANGGPAAQAGMGGVGIAAGHGGTNGRAGSSGLAGGGTGSGQAGASGSNAAAGQSSSGGAPAGGSSSAAGANSAGGSSGAGGGGGASLGAAAVLVPLTQAFCAAARACCSAEGMPAELGDCEANFPRRDSTFASLMRGAATLDQAGLPACLAAYQQAATKCEELPVWNACKGLLHGLRKENEKCVDVGECARDAGQTVACVIADSNAKEGVCTKVPHGKLGDACGTTCRVGDSCSFTSIGASDPSSITYCYEQDGLFCSFDTGHCQAIIALGSPCTASDSCGSTSFCDTTCKKSGVLGEACTQSCIPALSCINGQCRSPSFTVGGTCSGFWFGPY